MGDLMHIVLLFSASGIKFFNLVTGNGDVSLILNGFSYLIRYRAAQQWACEPSDNKVKPGHIFFKLWVITLRLYEHVQSLGIELQRVCLNMARLN